MRDGSTCAAPPVSSPAHPDGRISLVRTHPAEDATQRLLETGLDQGLVLHGRDIVGGEVEYVAALLDAGAKVNAVQNDGCTPLMSA